MKKFLYPDYYVRSVYTIPYKKLKAQGIKGLIFDIDNTLVPYDIPKSDEKLRLLFKQLTEMGFLISLVSNGRKTRVELFNEELQFFTVPRALKPSRRNLKKAMDYMKTDKETTAIIGDQIFTDILAGNRIKITTILVQPVSQKDEWITGIKRGIEKMVIKAYKRNRRKDDND